MKEAVICYGIMGVLIGVVFSLLFITFDNSWKKVLSSLCGITGSSGLIYISSIYFDITEQSMKFWTTSFLYIMFLLTFLAIMLLMCKLIKDKDDKDILRIRDILLGQKSYINKYYEKRMQEIDNKLNIPALKAREYAVLQKENSISNKEQYIQQELQKIEDMSKKKLKIKLPDKKNVVLTENFVESLPSYIGGFSKCISDIRYNTDLFTQGDSTNISNEKEKIQSYLLSIATFISQNIFGGSNDIRVHFRYYNEESKKYERLVSVIGTTISSKDMTPIPYENSMIKKSYECKRCLIKSINSDYDYQSNNYTKWKDYMTFTFYNLIRDDMPYLTFGISVKNIARYKDNFYFLSFVELETYLNDYIEAVNQIINFERVLYKEVDNSNE